MHFLVAWDIKPRGARWTEINAAMRESISGYSWVHPLETVFIIEIKKFSERTTLKEKLNLIADNYSGEVNFLLSPLNF